MNRRFRSSWYAGQMYGFVSGSLVLFVLLYEITNLYAQLLRSVLAERREREARLMTWDTVSASIGHEIKQPLSAMINNANAGLRWLNRATPDLEEAKASFKKIASDGDRAASLIASIRAMFKKDARTKTSLDINELIWEALALVRGELQEHRVSVQAEPNQQLPPVEADKLQLQQLLLNLITNAIDSMAARDGPRVLSVKSELHASGDVMLSVKDTGVGIDAQDIDRIFNPLFTTKSHGMGMRLAICRSIVEAHGGRLRATPNDGPGATFQFTIANQKRFPSSVGKAS